MRKLLLVVVFAIACMGLLAAPALASAATFTIHPNGHNDTKAIQKAFNAAVKAGPGSTVQLTAGHFFTNTIVVRNFKGYFRGAGEGRTTIDCLRGLDPSLPGVTLLSAPDLNPFTFLVGFVGGDVSVSTMSFHITATSPVDAASNDGSDVLQAIVVVIGNPDASSAFRHVSITAGAGNDRGYNADEDLIITGHAPHDLNGNPTSFPAIHGSESVCDCSFVGHDGIQVQGLTNGRLSITRSVFDDWALGCILDDSARGSQIVVCHNRMQASAWASVVLIQGWVAGGNGDPTLLPPLPAPHYLIYDNHMRALTSVVDGLYFAANGMWVEDDSLTYGAANRLCATIVGNTIDLATTDNVGIGEFATRGLRFFNNRMSGSALTGMYLGDDYGGPDGTTLYPVSGWKIVGNDFSNLTTSMASIVLGNGSSHCLVVGGPPPTTVLDNGTDNTLINVTPVTASASALSMRSDNFSKLDLMQRLR